MSNLPVIICYSNIGYSDFSENFLLNVTDKIKNHKVVFYCIDQEIYDLLIKYKSNIIEIILYNSNVSKNFENYGSSGFNKLMNLKTTIIKEALQLYNFIHFVDADIVFCKEPTELYYSDYSDYDIVYQNDAPPPNELFHTWTCAGNLTLRNTQNTHDLIDKIKEYENKFPNLNDQACQSKVFEDSGIKDIRLYPYAKLYQYPQYEYVCGYLVNNNMADINNIMVFHANHVTGKNEKINLLKKIKMWYL